MYHLFQGTTLMIILGFIVICEKNYLDIQQHSILCHTDKPFTEYARTFCWIHGTSYVREALRGKATGCFVDQTDVATEEDAPVTAYYLWLPYLLAVCFVLARMPRSIWKRFFESGLIGHIINGESTGEVAKNFVDFRHRYVLYSKITTVPLILVHHTIH